MTTNERTAARILRSKRLEVKTLLKPVVVECFDADGDWDAVSKLNEYIGTLIAIRTEILAGGKNTYLDNEKAG